MADKRAEKKSVNQSPVRGIDYLLFLLLLVLPPAGFAFSDWYQKSTEVLLPMQQIQKSYHSNRTVVFAEVTNIRDISLQFTEGRYAGSKEADTRRVYVKGLVSPVEPGETKKIGFTLFKDSFNSENLQLVFKESDYTNPEIHYSIESINLEPVEKSCDEDTEETCYRLRLKADLNNTGSEIIYGPQIMVRLWSKNGPAAIRVFEIDTGVRLNKWMPGKELSVEIDHAEQLDFRPARYDYSFDYQVVEKDPPWSFSTVAPVKSIHLRSQNRRFTWFHETPVLAKHPVSHSSLFFNSLL